MITLTTPRNIADVTRVQVVDVTFDEDNNVAKVILDPQSTAGHVYKTYELVVVDGVGTPATSSKKLVRIAPGPTVNPYREAFAVVNQVNIPNGYTNLRAAWYGAGVNRAQRRRAAETQGLLDGWIDASLAGTVA